MAKKAKTPMEEVGFELIGHWTEGETPNELSCMIDKDWWEKRALYAFTQGETVRHIGMAELLRNGLGRYLYAREGKRHEIAKIIHESLKIGTPVHIWGLSPSGGPAYRGGLQVDMIRGLEYPLVEKFQETIWDVSDE